MKPGVFYKWLADWNVGEDELDAYALEFRDAYVEARRRVGVGHYRLGKGLKAGKAEYWRGLAMRLWKERPSPTVYMDAQFSEQSFTPQPVQVTGDHGIRVYESGKKKEEYTGLTAEDALRMEATSFRVYRREHPDWSLGEILECERAGFSELFTWCTAIRGNDVPLAEKHAGAARNMIQKKSQAYREGYAETFPEVWQLYPEGRPYGNTGNL